MPKMERVVEAIVIAVVAVVVERISHCLGPAVDAYDRDRRTAMFVADLFNEGDVEAAGELFSWGESFVEEWVRRRDLGP